MVYSRYSLHPSGCMYWLLPQNGNWAKDCFWNGFEFLGMGPTNARTQNRPQCTTIRLGTSKRAVGRFEFCIHGRSKKVGTLPPRSPKPR